MSDVILIRPARKGSRAAVLTDMLGRTSGASLEEMMERTGWQAHSVRAAMTGLRRRGYVIVRRVSGERAIWFIEGRAQ